MEIQICRAYIVTEGGRARMTKAIANQFPVLMGLDADRWLQKNERLTVLGKVAGIGLLGSSRIRWFFLAEDREAGYVWLDWESFPYAERQPDTVPTTIIL